MALQELAHPRVAALVMDGVEEAELTQPVQALTAAGSSVDVISQNAGTIRAFRYHTPSIRISIDKSFDSVSPDEYDALLPPGGALNADALRAVSAPQAFATAFDHADKPIAAICHAPRLLASTNLLAGRTLASFHAIHDDLENAGGRWCDAPVVNDGNLITSRQPGDLPQFNAGMIALFSGSRARLAGASP